MGFRRAKSIDLRSFGAPASTPRAASMRKLDLGGVPGFCGLAERGYSGLCAFALPAEQSSRLDSVTSYATQRSRVSVSKTDHIFKGVVNRLYDYVSDARIGDRLPSERQLCGFLAASNTTIRAAISKM